MIYVSRGAGVGRELPALPFKIPDLPVSEEMSPLSSRPRHFFSSSLCWARSRRARSSADWGTKASSPAEGPGGAAPESFIPHYDHARVDKGEITSGFWWEESSGKGLGSPASSTS